MQGVFAIDDNLYLMDWYLWDDFHTLVALFISVHVLSLMKAANKDERAVDHLLKLREYELQAFIIIGTRIDKLMEHCRLTIKTRKIHLYIYI